MCDGVDRCHHPLTDEHLRRLAQIGLHELAGLFRRNSQGAGLYDGRLLMLALCQGAAQHRIDGLHGIKDLDVWGFFAARDGAPFPVHWRREADFGASTLGYHPADRARGFVGRRVDVLGRSIPAPHGAGAVDTVRAYLSPPVRGTPWYLAQRPVIALHPPSLFGVQVWP